MQQVNTLGIADGTAINVGRGTQVITEWLWRAALCRLNQRRRLLFRAIAALFRQITANPQPDPTCYLGTYVPFLDSTQPPIHGND